MLLCKPNLPHSKPGLSVSRRRSPEHRTKSPEKEGKRKEDRRKYGENSVDLSDQKVCYRFNAISPPPKLSLVHKGWPPGLCLSQNSLPLGYSLYYASRGWAGTGEAEARLSLLYVVQVHARTSTDERLDKNLHTVSYKPLDSVPEQRSSSWLCPAALMI